MSYCTAQELIDQGVVADPARIDESILLAEKYIDKMTGQFFEKKSLPLVFDADGKSNILFLPFFCIRVNELTLNDSLLVVDDFTLYNRFYPDDRNNPKIIFVTAPLEGRLNITVDGDWGYVESDETTPLLIKKVCSQLAISNIADLTDPDRTDLIDRGRITEEETDDHRYKLGELVASGDLTGNPEIDNILRAYQASMGIESA